MVGQDHEWSGLVQPQSTNWNVALTATVDGVSSTATVNFGIVILCSGQSNMQVSQAGHLPSALSIISFEPRVLPMPTDVPNCHLTL